MTRYGGLCTQFYDIDKPDAPPDALAFYAAHARRSIGPILEPMCGSGRFLLPLRAEGLDIEGVDRSQEMLDACRAAARERGLEVVVHRQSVEELALSRRFGLIFIASGSFCLLTRSESVGKALHSLHAAMLPGATFLAEIERALPREPSQSGVWGGRWVRRPDGAKIIFSWLDQYSGVENVSYGIHKYELVESGKLLEVEYEDFELKFYEIPELVALFEQAGFSNVEVLEPFEENPPGEADDAFVVRCTRA